MAKKPLSSPSAFAGVQQKLDAVFPWLTPFLLFFAITGTSRFLAVVLAAVCLVFALGRGPARTLRERLSPLTVSVFAYALVCLLSGLWCHFGLYAARESGKTLAALALFGLLVTRLRREHLRLLLRIFTGVLTLIAWLCIDAASLQLFTRGFIALMAPLGVGYSLDTMGYEAGTRITGIFSNANVSAGLLALGLVVGLYLLRTAVSRRERVLVSLGLGIQSLAFFLSFSMGAMAAFAVTCAVYLLFSARGTRLGLFLLMLVCVVSTVVCAFASTPFLGTASPLPLLASVVCGGLIWGLDAVCSRGLLPKLEGRQKAVAVIGGGLAVLAVVYVVLAFNLTGGTVLSPDAPLERAVYPDAGTYTLSWEGADAQAVIYSQTDAELMMHTNTVLYRGPLSGASFTVPEGSRVVWFQLTGDGALESLSLSDGTSVPLGYKLLPAFAANRLQGLWANQNFIQRLVFFQDGIKLWLASPLIGWGVGGVEGQITAVQSFYYESKYVHNQFIQIMAEAGILGLAAFAAMLGSAVWMLLRRRRQDDDPMTAMLAAGLAMMVFHSLTEVVWSTQIYQCAVFALFAVMVLFCRDAPAAAGRGVGRLAAVSLWCVTAVFAVLLTGNLLAARQMRTLDTSGMTPDSFMAALERMDAMDVYDDADYKVNLMGNALRSGTAAGQSTAARCARQLRATEEFDACYNVAAYYYLPLRDLTGFFDAVSAGLRQERSNPAAWDSAFHLFQSAFQQLDVEYVEEFAAGVLAAGQELDDANAVLMAPITLDEGNQTLLDAVWSLNGATGQAAWDIIADALDTVEAAGEDVAS